MPGATWRLARRVLRGGSWNNNQNNARAVYRNNNHPDNRNNNVGLRVVRRPTSSAVPVP
jgi:formylglycine-generating enzyme required for sulfatase activity